MRKAVRVGDITVSLDRAGQGPAVLFVHGFPFDRSMWRRQVRGLAGFDRIAPDLRGLGESEMGNEPVTMAAYADDLGGVLDQCGVETSVMCGLSMGGYVALEFMRRHPERARGLVLMDTRAEADSPNGRLGRDEMAGLAQREGMQAIYEQMAPKLLAKRRVAGRPNAVRHLRSMVLSAPVAGAVAALSAMRERADATEWLGAIEAPTLVMVGAEDELTPVEAAQTIARGIPGARLTVVPGAGHLPPMERPRLTTRILRDFLIELD